MPRLYRSEAAQAEVQQWCTERLASWPVPHETYRVETDEGLTHVVGAGAGSTTVVYLPGTNFNAATSLSLLSTLAATCRVYAADLPGQPGLSAPVRQRAAPEMHESWLRQLLRALSLRRGGGVVLLGHSRGAHVALCADPADVSGLALVNPAGLVKVAVDAGTLRTAVPWVVRPTKERSRALLQLMSAPGCEPAPELVDWMFMVSAMCRTTGAPGPLPRRVTDRWRGSAVTVTTGERDRFFPAHRLELAARERLGCGIAVVPDAGHLSLEEQPSVVLHHALAPLVGHRDDSA